jgi:hypothetical protein
MHLTRERFARAVQQTSATATEAEEWWALRSRALYFVHLLWHWCAVYMMSTKIRIYISLYTYLHRHTYTNTYYICTYTCVYSTVLNLDIYDSSSYPGGSHGRAPFVTEDIKNQIFKKWRYFWEF